MIFNIFLRHLQCKTISINMHFISHIFISNLSHFMFFNMLIFIYSLYFQDNQLFFIKPSSISCQPNCWEYHHGQERWKRTRNRRYRKRRWKRRLWRWKWGLWRWKRALWRWKRGLWRWKWRLWRWKWRWRWWWKWRILWEWRLLSRWWIRIWVWGGKIRRIKMIMKKYLYSSKIVFIKLIC